MKYYYRHKGSYYPWVEVEKLETEIKNCDKQQIELTKSEYDLLIKINDERKEYKELE